MIQTKDILLKNSMDSIEWLLQEKYNLSSYDAKKAIKDSNVAKIYAENFEQSLHDPIEEWAEVAYKFWKNTSK